MHQQSRPVFRLFVKIVVPVVVIRLAYVHRLAILPRRLDYKLFIDMTNLRLAVGYASLAILHFQHRYVGRRPFSQRPYIVCLPNSVCGSPRDCFDDVHQWHTHMKHFGHHVDQIVLVVVEDSRMVVGADHVRPEGFPRAQFGHRPRERVLAVPDVEQDAAALRAQRGGQNSLRTGVANRARKSVKTMGVDVAGTQISRARNGGTYGEEYDSTVCRTGESAEKCFQKKNEK